MLSSWEDKYDKNIVMLPGMTLVVSFQRNAKNVNFPPALCVGNFRETDTFLTASSEGNGNFRCPSISQRELSISPKFPCKDYWEI